MSAPRMARLALLAGAALSAGQLRAQSPPVFRTAVEAVWVDVFVSSRKAPVLGLQAGDFELLDNGVRQRVSLVDSSAVGVSAVLVLDTSESVRGARLERLKVACRALLDGLTARDRAALITFSHRIALRADAGADRRSVGLALDLVPAKGATSAFDALYAALKRPWPERPMILLFTDGADTLSWLQPKEVVEAARESDALVHVVGAVQAGGGGSEAEYLSRLREIARITGGRFWELSPGASLKDRFLEILAATKVRYLLNYHPSGVSQTGRHRLRVKVRGRDLEVRHRLEYTVPASRPAQ